MDCKDYVSLKWRFLYSQNSMDALSMVFTNEHWMMFNLVTHNPISCNTTLCSWPQTLSYTTKKHHKCIDVQLHMILKLIAIVVGESGHTSLNLLRLSFHNR